MTGANKFISQVNVAVEAGVTRDMTEVTAGGNFERRLLPTGLAFVVFTGYIDLGKHPQEFKGKAKPPAPEAKLIFHVVGGVGTDQEGNRVPFVTDEDVSTGFRPMLSDYYDLVLHQTENAGARKIFQKMNYGKDATHFAQLLGKAYLLQIGVKESTKKAGEFYNTWDLKELAPPIDAMTGQYYDVPALPNDDFYKCFIWEQPTQDMWDSIHVEGEYEKDGKKYSKNRYQEKIQKAVDFIGSPIEAMLMGGSGLPTLVADNTVEGEGTTPTPAVPSTDSDDDLPF